MRRHIISSEEYEAIVKMEKGTQDKRISRKLKVLMLRYEGLNNKAIAEHLEISETRVIHLVGEYLRLGLEEYARKKYGGNHRNLCEEEEQEILDEFKKQAESG